MKEYIQDVVHLCGTWSYTGAVAGGPVSKVVCDIRSAVRWWSAVRALKSAT